MAILDAFAGGDRDELLLERCRTGLWLCATSITLFGFTDPFLHPGLLVPIYAIKALQLTFIALFFRVLRMPHPRSRLRLLAQLGVATVAVTTAWSGIVTGDDVTTACLLVVLTMGTAALLPWGVRAQIFTQATTALCVLWINTAVGRYYTYLPIVVVIGSSFSVYMSYTLERYRVEQMRIRALLGEAQARQHQKEIAHAARLSTLGGMAAGLAHELNQPLSAIVSYARGCVRRLQVDELSTSALVEVLEEISAQALRAGEVLRRIRDFLRGDVRRETVDLNDVVRRALRLADPEARRAGVRVDLDLAAEALTATVDVVQIEQVLLNLVQNGFDVMSANDGRERVLTIRTRRLAPETLEVAVSDTGVGMSPEVAERLYDPFFTTKPDGLGLGLSISRSIVEAHGGRLSAVSDTQGGTTFRFTLRAPRERTEDAA